ncbi:unnamed protein product [Amoebophrya sp. A25]|nr:unnamed protein product [Amoebophrya sp. A25]|eukprot:GSA25T00011683001.1
MRATFRSARAQNSLRSFSFSPTSHYRHRAFAALRPACYSGDKK